MSFGTIAADYNRFRPAPPDQAIDWLLPGSCLVAVDLAAGTGLVSRVLRRHVARVVAIEPDERMAAVLSACSPGVHATRGIGEALPLADASADAVLISSAWHWLDPVRAIPELSRVLRPGGRLGLLATGIDRGTGWLREADPFWQPADGAPTDVQRAEYPETELFDAVATTSLAFTQTMTPDDFIGMMSTYSRLITASEEERTAHLGYIRTQIERLFPHAVTVDVPMRTRCWRAERAR